MAPVLHPSIVRVTAHALMTGEVVSLTLIVWLHVAEWPHASVTVQRLVTTVGHVPAAISIYVTAVMPHASDVFPLFGALSNSTSVDAVSVVENGGLVITPVLQPSMVRVAAHALITGEVVSFTFIV